MEQARTECGRELQDPKAYLKVDAIMFYHVYCMQAQSTDLDKSVLDMNTHYLELKVSLRELEGDPEAATCADIEVFKATTKRLIINCIPHTNQSKIPEMDLTRLFCFLFLWQEHQHQYICRKPVTWWEILGA